jgi:hypothetical protein
MFAPLTFYKREDHTTFYMRNALPLHVHVEDFRWRLEGDRLHVQLLATKNIPFVEIKANFEAKPWQKVAGQ